MSIDIASSVDTLFALVGTGIFIIGGYRAIELSRVLVGGMYKNRAYWTLGLVGAITFFGASQYVPDPSGLLGFFGFLVFTFALFLFVDSNIRVVKEIDFFHREILRWGTFRKPVLAAMIITGVLLTITNGVNPTLSNGSSIWVGLSIASYFVVLATAFTYSAAGLIVGARRTPDTSMRKFVRMLALSLASFTIFFTIWIPLDVVSTAVGNAVSDFFLIPASYFIYRAVMSLSPLGRVEKVAVGNTSFK